MRVEVLSAHERRRRWRYEDKIRIVEETLEPGVSVCAVARRDGVANSLLCTWRRQAREGRLGGGDPAPPMFVPVAIAPELAGASVPALVERASPAAGEKAEAAPPRVRRRKTGVIEIGLGGGRRVRVDSDVDADALRRVLDALGAP